MPKIIQQNKHTHSDKEGDVLLERLSHVCENGFNEGFCNAVSDEIAHKDIGGKPNHRREIPSFVFEREIFIQKITQYATEEIIGRR